MCVLECGVILLREGGVDVGVIRSIGALGQEVSFDCICDSMSEEQGRYCDDVNDACEDISEEQGRYCDDVNVGNGSCEDMSEEQGRYCDDVNGACEDMSEEQGRYRDAEEAGVCTRVRSDTTERRRC